MDVRSRAIRSTPHCSGLVNLRRLAAEPDMEARRDDDPGALEALLLAPVGVGAADARGARAPAGPAAPARGRPARGARRAPGRDRGLRHATAGSCSPTRTPRRCSATSTTSCSGSRCRCCGPSACASATRATWSSTSRPTTRCGSRPAPTACAATAREFVGEMSWGIVETEAGPLLLAIGRDMTAHREALDAVQRQSRAGRGRRRAGRAGAGGRGRRRPGGRGGRAAARDAAADRARDLARRGESSPRGAAADEPPLSFEIRTGDEVFGELSRRRRGARSTRTRRTSCAASPTCSRPRWGGCAARSRCATRRCTTR